MQYLNYQSDRLHLESVDLAQLCRDFDTPSYVYSKAQIIANWQAFISAAPIDNIQIKYAVKANSNLSILKLFKDLGAGFDIVSAGELQRVLYLGVDAGDVVFSGVGKTATELELALSQPLGCINIESKAELERIVDMARDMNCQVNISFRVNPNIDAKSHPYISTGLKENKFGCAIDDVLSWVQAYQNHPNLHVVGLSCHIGSQITELSPFKQAIDTMVNLYRQLKAKGCCLKFLNLGGGLGISYEGQAIPSIADYLALFASWPEGLGLHLEPGRALIGNAGLLLTRVNYLKQTELKHFAILDAGMNDLVRPSFYGAWHNVRPLHQTHVEAQVFDLVGPVCESSDVLARERRLSIRQGDYLAIEDVGAYGASMSSHYNSRPKAAELWVDGHSVKVLRARETFEDLIRHECIND